MLVARSAAASATEAHRIAARYSDAGLHPGAHTTNWFHFETVRTGQPGTFRTFSPTPTVRVRYAANVGRRPSAAENADQNPDRAVILAAVRRFRDIIAKK